jgi:hypothetical protein
MTSFLQRSSQRVGNVLVVALFVAFVLLVWVFPSGVASWSRRDWTGYLPAWYVAASIIGCIYFCVGLFYFYDKFIVPFKHETRRVGSPPAGLFSITLQWFVPMFLVHVFIVLGAFLTIERSPTEEPIFTHAHMYGVIFVRNSGALVTEKEELWSSADKYRKYLKGSQPRPDQQNNTGAEPAPETTASASQAVAVGPPEVNINKIPYLIAIGFGYLGTLIYTLTDLSRRFYTSDLYPKTYVNYVIRFIFAPSLCLVIAYSMVGAWPVQVAPLLFFFIGHFPNRGLQFIEEKASILLGSKKRQEKQEVALSMLQGMSDYMIYRFNEIGIDDAQNLALADLDFLHENVGYGSRLLCDFVAQAMLLVHLREYFATLQGAGIRNVICFRQVVSTTTYRDLAALLKIPPEILLAFLNILETDQMRERVKALELRAMQSDHQQSPQPDVGSSSPVLVP